MSTINEIQEAISRLPANEKSVLAAWLQSQEEPIMSEAEKKLCSRRLGSNLSLRGRTSVSKKLSASSREVILKVPSAWVTSWPIARSCWPTSPNSERRIVVVDHLCVVSRANPLTSPIAFEPLSTSSKSGISGTPRDAIPGIASAKVDHARSRGRHLPGAGAVAVVVDPGAIPWAFTVGCP